MANLQAKRRRIKKKKYKPPVEWRCIPHERAIHATLTALEKWRGQHTNIKDHIHNSIIHNSIINFFALKVFQAELPNSLSLINTTRTTGNTYRKSVSIFSISFIHSIHFRHIMLPVSSFFHPRDWINSVMLMYITTNTKISRLFHNYGSYILKFVI